jgi:chemotaxis signal transduction protein
MCVAGDVYSMILVDAVEDVVELPSSGIYAPLETIGPQVREFVAGQTDYRERSAVILDLEKVFARVVEEGNASG